MENDREREFLILDENVLLTLFKVINCIANV